MIELELNRGETPTAATSAANSIKQLFGRDTLLKLVAALGKHGFGKTARWGESENKPAVLTGLIQKCLPLPQDTPEAIAVAAGHLRLNGLSNSDLSILAGSSRSHRR